MPYVAGTAALVELFSSGGDIDQGKGVLTQTAEKIGGINEARAQRDAISEARGAQRDQMKALQDKAIADQQNLENRAAGNAARRRARAGVGSLLTQPTLGQPAAPVYAGKTLLGS